MTACITCQTAGLDGTNVAACVLQMAGGGEFADLLEDQRYEIAIEALFADPPQSTEATVEER